MKMKRNTALRVLSWLVVFAVANATQLGTVMLDTADSLLPERPGAAWLLVFVVLTILATLLAACLISLHGEDEPAITPEPVAKPVIPDKLTFHV